MSKTLKQKIRHILYDEDGKLNLKVPLKLRWSYINKIRRHNYDRDLDRAGLADRREQARNADMNNQINELLQEQKL